MSLSVSARTLSVILLCSTFSAQDVFAQPGSKQAQSTIASSSQGAGGASLPGLSYAQDKWGKELTLPTQEGLHVVCYQLVYTNSAMQPFVLQPTSKITRDNGDKVPCRALDANNPLLMDELLTVAIDARAIDIKRLKVLNINVTTQQGSPLNPTPLRPSFGSSLPATDLSYEKIYFLTWPNRIPGDVLPTVSVNVLYTPPAPGSAWTQNTFYPAGSIVMPDNAGGRFYLTRDGGISGAEKPTSWMITQPATITDNHVTWQYVGISPPSGSQSPKPWAKETPYDVGSVIIAPTNLNFYMAVKVEGDAKTGGSPQDFPVPQPAVTHEKPATQDAKTTDNNIEWQDQRRVDVTCGDKASQTKHWQSSHPYKAGEVICDQEDGEQYKALETGTSGPDLPKFKQYAKSITMPIDWLDMGVATPAAVASGGQPADQSINLITFQFSQSHSLSYYNLAAGVICSSVKNKTFGFAAAGSTGSTNSGVPIQTSSTPLVDPVLLFTFYPRPFDAETRQGAFWHDFRAGTGISFGVSLNSPGNNFYLGGSSEIRRLVQLVYGINVAKVPKLVHAAFVPSSGSSPATVQTFSAGIFVGLTFNISGFIQGGGGGGKSSSGGQ